MTDESPFPPSHDVTRSVESPTQTIGPYRVLAPLGAGGMGEVFRARDSKLNRDVALKVLPAAFALDPDRLARFAREAQALAALNHPHIGAIYGLEESSGRQALVLELVEGPTLANRIAQGQIPVRDVLAIAGQIADALQAAHAKGIIHRDLKPANVKVTRAGIVKVLDFGLAKVGMSDVQRVLVSEAPTMADATRAGAVLGTAAYMSPEQARGLAVDGRTDIWAFGCVLFEMLAGRKAFPADGTSDSIAKTLEDEPDWSRLPKATPSAIQRLIRQCLQKDVSQRLQTIAQARTAIERVQAPRLLSRRSAIGVGVVALAAIAVGVYVWSRADRRPSASRSEWVQLTKLDSVTQPALSPDGRMLAFIRGPNTFVSPGELYLKLLPDGESIALTHDNLPKMSPVFSPDGSRIAYTVGGVNSWDTWEVPALRGEPRPWLLNASGLTWITASDLLFSEIKVRNHMAIVRSSESRALAHDLYVPPRETGMAHRSYASPDRKWVLLAEMDGPWLPCRLLAIDGRSSQPVGPASAQCTGAAWSPDGRWMYFSADAGDGFHVWRQRFPNGKPEEISAGPTEEEGLAVAPDGKSIVTSVGLAQRSVWFHDAGGDRLISLEGYAYWPLLSADGRKVCFRVMRSAGSGQSPSELWVAEVSSGAMTRLFPGQMVTSYDVSRDDRVVAAVLESDGHSRVWASPLDGREPPRRLPGAEGDNPRFASDGQIIFRVPEGTTAFLYRMRENGERREKILEAPGTVFGTVSPDGEWLSGDVGNRATGSFLLSMSGRTPGPLLQDLRAQRLRWDADGKHVSLSIQDGAVSAFGTGRTYVLPVGADSVLPRIPPGGFKTESEIAALPGVVTIPYGDVSLGPTPSTYVFSRFTTTRNLYRIPLQ